MRPLLVLLLALFAACGDPGSFDGGSGGGSGGSSGSGGGGGSTGDGLPCDVADIVSRHCISCHGTTPTVGAPMSLVTRADFLKPSLLVPQLNYAQRSAVRVGSANSPMPPLPYVQLTTAERDIFTTWAGSDTPAGTCTAGPPDGGSSMTPAQTTCESNSAWNAGIRGSSHMNPGLACRSCHLGDNFMGQNPTGAVEAFRAYFFMGTVFPSLHGRDLCNGAPPAGTVVEILDKNGVVQLRMQAAPPSGNFFSTSTMAGIQLPYTARVLANGKSVSMNTPQTNGDCNTCHTEQGLSGAPGRIVWPQ